MMFCFLLQFVVLIGICDVKGCDAKVASTAIDNNVIMMTSNFSHRGEIFAQVNHLPIKLHKIVFDIFLFPSFFDAFP